MQQSDFQPTDLKERRKHMCIIVKNSVYMIYRFRYGLIFDIFLKLNLSSLK